MAYAPSRDFGTFPFICLLEIPCAISMHVEESVNTCSRISQYM